MRWLPHHRPTWRRLAGSAILAAASIVPAHADKLVTVRSTVDRAYAARRAETDPPRSESYAFIKGKYFNEIPMDRYLERMDFRTIASILAADLKKQNYEPAKTLLSADLLLVVHWGVTQANESQASMLSYDPDGLRQATEAFDSARAAVDDMSTRGSMEAQSQVLQNAADASLSLRSAQSTAVSTYSRSEARGETNAVLLGLQTAMAEEDKSPFTTAMADTLRLMINEERYFVVVIAYDGAAMREGRKRRVWTTRMSIRAAGVNFAVALDRLSAVGADFHGRPQDGLAIESSKNRRATGSGTVKIGELTVLGDDAPPKPVR